MRGNEDMSKVHAKDYLTEFSNNKPEWLKVLIKEAIETNGNISENRKVEIFENLLNNTQLQVQSAPTTKTQQNSEKLILKTLTHASGVNALCENQTIKFSPDVTVLYGLNGSGKSSYFRILNNASGGTQQKRILPNIYSDDADRKPINVSIDYKIGNTDQTHSCNGSITTCADFHGVKVFDSSYLSGLLQPKSPDEAFVYPLGLHLFGYIVNIMDSFTSKLSSFANQEHQQLPTIKTDFFCETLKDRFTNRQDFSNTERTAVRDKFSFSDIDDDTLSKKKNELNQLQQTNYQDTISLLAKNNTAFAEFATKINNATNSLKTYGEKLKKALEDYANAKLKNDEARKQSEIITRLSKSDSVEWKTFIKAGQAYSAKLEKSEPAKCPYCHQELKSPEAIDIIKAYADFLNDTSESELNDAKQNLERIKKEIDRIDVAIVISDEIKEVLGDSKELQDKITKVSQYKAVLSSVEIAESIPMIDFDFAKELKILDDKKKENKTTITNLATSKKEKDSKILDLQKIISELREKKSISEQKEEIEKYFSVYDNKNRIDAKKAETRTTELTKISNQAQNSLLTEALKTRFENELKFLGKNHLKVELDGKSGSKGSFTTQLKLKSNSQIKDILSEGEQKAVGLAMFFAEIQDGNYPIILDDPTTSLDHKIVDKLAQRILSFGNQIIIFKHYQFFLNSLNSTGKGHFCDKYGNTTCGKITKHIFVYEVDESISNKGIINHYLGRDSKSCISNIENQINSITVNDLKDVPKNIRKCVEYLIDEKILKDQLLRKYCAGQNIAWDKLKFVNPYSANIVDKLHEIHGRVSGGEIHVDMESQENPPTPEELNDFLTTLKEIQTDSYHC